jgi:hypothetical protein
VFDGGDMKAIGYIIVTIALLIYSATFNGWALATLWRWFIEPTFSLAPSLNIPSAVGLCYVVSFLSQQVKIDTKAKKVPYSETLAKSLITSTVKPVIFICFGYILTFFL